MARVKQKSKAFGAKKSAEQKNNKKVNPFDLIFKKRTGNEPNPYNFSKGHSVAASRKKGVENRQKTLGIEYKQLSRVNKIVDKRVAQKDYNLTSEQKAEKRFVLQRKKLFSAKNRFNLDDKQEEKFADFPANGPIEEDQDVQSDDAGELGPDLVAMANFGGGSFGDPLDGLDKDSRPKRRDVLANLIALSKQSKTMRRMEKDVQLDKTEDLNELFVKLQGSGMLATSKENNNTILKPSSMDDYDSIYRELKSDNRIKEPTTENPQQEQQAKVGVSQAQQFAQLLREYNELAEDHSVENISTLGVLIPKMHALAKKKPIECSQEVLQLLAEKRQQTLVVPSSCLGISFPLVAFLELVCELYCTSSWAVHPVATPTLAFAMQVLTSTKLQSSQHCAQAILFLSMLAKWADQSKRYLPEAIAFLHDTLSLCLEEPKRKQFPTKVFSTCKPQEQLLFLNKKSEVPSIAPLSIANAFGQQQGEDENLFKLQTIRVLVAVTLKFTQIYARPILDVVNGLPTECYPSCLVAEVESLQAALQSVCESRGFTQMKVRSRRQEKTRQITFLEPRVEEHFNPERPRKESAGRAGKANMAHKQMKQRLRKETRGAAKELRLDAKYIAKMQDERNSKVSRERKEKTNRIMQGLQSQESEYKKRTAKKF